MPAGFPQPPFQGGQRTFSVCSLIVSVCFAFLLPTGASQAQTSIENRAYLNLRNVAGDFGMDSKWLETGKIIRLYSKWTTLEFELHKRAFTINGEVVHLGDPIAASGTHLWISQRDVEKTLQPILTPQVFTAPKALRHIVIDPGHGGRDEGAANRQFNLFEKNLTLDLARRLKRKLQAAGFEVTLTRNDDTYLSLSQRSTFANNQNADLFLSLHFNAAHRSDVQGIETFAFTPLMQPSTSRASLHASDKRLYPGNANDPWNVLVAFYIQRELTRAFPDSPDRGLKRARFNVLRDVNMPAALVESGFLSHDIEGPNLGSAQRREQIADAILQGVLTYQRTLSRLNGS